MSEIFLEFQGRHRGESAILFGSGPSIKEFNSSVGSIKVGMNEQIYLDLDLDYWFMGDTTPRYPERFLNHFDDYNNYQPRIQKFIRRALWNDKAAMPSGMLHSKYYDCEKGDDNDTCQFKKNLGNEPIIGKRSITFEALQFILYTGASEIYLVGHDCKYTTGTFRTQYSESACRLNEKNLRNYWKSCGEWIAEAYPQTKIFSVNPVGLKGLFPEKNL